MDNNQSNIFTGFMLLVAIVAVAGFIAWTLVGA